MRPRPTCWPSLLPTRHHHKAQASSPPHTTSHEMPASQHQTTKPARNALRHSKRHALRGCLLWLGQNVDAFLAFLLIGSRRPGQLQQCPFHNSTSPPRRLAQMFEWTTRWTTAPRHSHCNLPVDRTHDGGPGAPPHPNSSAATPRRPTKTPHGAVIPCRETRHDSNQ